MRYLPRMYFWQQWLKRSVVVRGVRPHWLTMLAAPVRYGLLLATGRSPFVRSHGDKDLLRN